MTIQNENGETRFSKIWVTKNGLSTEKPSEENRMSQQDAEAMADVILDAIGLERLA